eukprot:3494509-Pleurochrysis_carterae.AAC.2
MKKRYAWPYECSYRAVEACAVPVQIYNFYEAVVVVKSCPASRRHRDGRQRAVYGLSGRQV